MWFCWIFLTIRNASFELLHLRRTSKNLDPTEFEIFLSETWVFLWCPAVSLKGGIDISTRWKDNSLREIQNLGQMRGHFPRFQLRVLPSGPLDFNIVDRLCFQSQWVSRMAMFFPFFPLLNGEQTSKWLGSWSSSQVVIIVLFWRAVLKVQQDEYEDQSLILQFFHGFRLGTTLIFLLHWDHTYVPYNKKCWFLGTPGGESMGLCPGISLTNHTWRGHSAFMKSRGLITG